MMREPAPPIRRLPRTVRLDASDAAVFERPAPPGEWAVSGAFAFLGNVAVSGKAQQAFANGFLGLGSFGWASLVIVSDAAPDEVSRAVAALARHLVAEYGAPSMQAAEAAATEEIAFAASLCDGHAVGTFLAVSRRFEGDEVVESFRAVLDPAGSAVEIGVSCPAWSLQVEERSAETGASPIDLVDLARRGRPE
jgi:hypothetical protein